MRSFILPCLIISGLLLTGCITDQLNTKPEIQGLEGAAMQQTLFNPGRKSDATLRIGGELIVELSSNPTTGYRWVQLEGDETITALTDDSYTSDPAPEGLVGGGGQQRLVFEAKAKGKTRLVLSYQRFNGSSADEKTIDVKVIDR